MSALLDSLLAGHEEPAAHLLREAGLPGPRSEAWKYTPLRAFERRRFAAATPLPADAALLADIPAPRIVFVNGHFDAGLSDFDGLGEDIDIDCRHHERAALEIPAQADAWQPAGDAVFANLNALLARNGARIQVRGSISQPLHLVSLGIGDGDDRVSHLRHQLHLMQGAALTLVEHQLGVEAHANFDNSHIEIRLEAEAQLQHLRLQHDSNAASRYLRSEVRLEQDAHYRRLDLELGAALSRHELNLKLQGSGAHAACGGLLLGDGRRHLDTRLEITHAARDTRCDLPWRGLADDRAKLAFHGGITILAGADGSDADLQNRNLLLSDTADINTQPVLVIHADEVQAAHGATVGQLDPTALFYLRSRGIGELEARQMLTAAFVHDLLSMVEDAQLRAMLEAHVDRALARRESAA
ncbi:Fe-S cluster assembly protein SufD [Luteimonas sp. e5]